MEIKLQDIAQNVNMQVKANWTNDIRTKNGKNTIVLFVVGNYFEAYNESAEALHDICKIPLFFMGSISSTDFKKESADWIFPKMIRKGYKFCIFENGQY